MNLTFQKGIINGMVLPNRFIRSATWEGMATDEGAVTPRLIDTMIALARGGVGLIVSSHSYVLPEGKATPWQVGIYSDELMPGLEKMAAAVHGAGGRMVVQLAHAGFFTNEKMAGQAPRVVSDFPELGDAPRRELTAEEIEGLPVAFAEAARRAKAAGYDGVELHAAHGYLLSQFLSPIFNRRQDEYGGDIQGRSRFPVRVVRAVREMVGPDFPVLIKMNGRDYAENGLSLDDAVQAAGRLVEAGIDAIELSGGLLNGGKMSPSRPGIDSAEKEAYFREDARAFKKETQVPLILVGGLRSIEVAEALLEDNLADYISMSRPLIREPGLINRWKNGDLSPAKCKSDNLCFKPGREGKGIYCLTEEREMRRNTRRSDPEDSSKG